MPIKDNIKRLKEEIPSHVKVLAATKTRTTSQIKEAINSGIRIFGENYVQEAEKKYSDIKKNNSIELCFIGHLQKNKINRALKIFDVINIDSFEIAEAIDKRTDKKIKVLIEVNISNEPDKPGCKPDELISLIKKISKLNNIEVKGLMGMAPHFEDDKKTRPYFKKMKKLFENIKNLKLKSLKNSKNFLGHKKSPDLRSSTSLAMSSDFFVNIKMDILSLGMTHDYKIAIEEGSNLIRIGSFIFD